MEEVILTRGMYTHTEKTGEKVWVLSTMISKKSGKPFLAFVDIKPDGKAGDEVYCLTIEEFNKIYK